MPLPISVRRVLAVVLPLVVASSISSCASQEICLDAGPQTPRDITRSAGNNRVTFDLAPPASELQLCNLHFHRNAEHRGPGFSIYAGDGEFGGYRCNGSPPVAASPASAQARCENVWPGDTIEVHWVYSSCDVEPGPGLGSCVPDSCAEPVLRVEAQVFQVVEDPTALDFSDFDLALSPSDGRHQPRALPEGGGLPIEFRGSTTGPKYDDFHCSSVQVTWNVRPECLALDIDSLGSWCGDNQFDESRAHGVRTLVTDPRLLSKIE